MEDILTHRKLTKQEERRAENYPQSDVFLWHNANPHGKLTGDCVVRAISIATGLTYDAVVDGLVAVWRKTGFHITDPRCYGRYIESLGFTLIGQPKDDDGRKLMGAEYCRYLTRVKSHEIKSVIANIGTRHMCCMKPIAVGNESQARFRILDVFDPSDCCVGKVWVQYKSRYPAP